METTHRGVTRWEFILLGSLLVITGILLLPLVQQPMDGDWPVLHCQNNLHQLGFALHNYHERFGSFPPAVVVDEHGNRLHSWRTILLPDVDATPLYSEYRFDVPWNSPHNQHIAAGAEVVRNMAQCRAPSLSPPPASRTNYLAVVGPHTAWRGAECVRLADVTDGTDRTIFLIEVGNSDVDWFEPRDLEWDKLSFKLNDPGSLSPGSRHVEPETWLRDAVSYVNVLLVDGAVKKLPVDTPPDVLKALLTIDGGESFDPPWLK
jgi:hypothetical protein